MNKRGEEGWTLAEMIVAVVVLVIMVFAVTILLKGKGGGLMTSIKNLFRFGREFLVLI